MSIDRVNGHSERVRVPTPQLELERRWTAVREAMRVADTEALLVHNHVDNLGGYVKYFCDLHASGGYPLSVVFPRDDAMTMVMHGAQGAVRNVSPDKDPFFYGVKRVVTTSSFASATYTARYDPEQIADALRPYAASRIGIAGIGQIPYLWMEALHAALPHAEFFDASEIVDPIKAVKSEYEQQAIRATAAMQVKALEAGLDAIRPGVREWEVLATVSSAANALGSNFGVLRIGSAPAGEPATINPPRHQNRVLRPGDHLTILVESGGPEGYFGEIARTVSIGSPDDDLIAEHDFARQAWAFAVEDLRPGAVPHELFAKYNEFMLSNNRAPEERLHSHGQGYDIVERPLIRYDESMPLAEGMLLALHPLSVKGSSAIFLCDNIFVGHDGATEPLHGVEQRILEV